MVIAPGSKPLLFALFDILEGDVLLPRPSWVSYEPQVEHARKKLFWVETDEHDRHTISCNKSDSSSCKQCTKMLCKVESLEATYQRAIRANASPRIMLVNSPSNPTGQVFSRTVVDTIARFCRDKGITLISDEIYSDLCFNAGDVGISAFRSNPINSAPVVMTGGLSKVS